MRTPVRHRTTTRTPATAALAAVFVLVAAVAASLGLVVGRAYADSTQPFGDNTTGSIANRLHGTHRIGWWAVILDEGGYNGRRHAEEVKIATGHGKRWVGIIHVPSGNATRVHRALAGQWFAQRGTSFVLPLQSYDWTNGGSGATYRTTAKWAAKRLGSGWNVVAP